MLKKSKPACTASSPSVALFHRNPIRFFPLFDPARHAKTTGKGRAAGDSRVLTGRCAKGMTELAVGTRPRGVRISRERGRGEERRGQGQEEWVSIKRGASEPLTGVGWRSAVRSREKARLEPITEMRSSRMPAPSICGGAVGRLLSPILSTLAMSSSTRRDRVDIDSRLPATFGSLLDPRASSAAALVTAGAVIS